MAIRKPIVAGKFYEFSPTRLDNQIKDCFLHEKGPGDLPLKTRKKEIKAIIVPHAGYPFSGPCAAWAYKEIAESKLPDTYILLGLDHSGYGKSALTLDSWETPLGMMRIDNELGSHLLKKTELINDPGAHSMEHSIEVQLPFLQFANKSDLDKTRILPITISQDLDLKKLALDIQESIMDLNRKVIFIVSSDFTHYGKNYRYVPFSSDVPKRLYELDAGAIKFIKELDADGFASYVDQTMATICGRQPIYLLAKLLKKTKGELLQYYTSGDLSGGNYKNAVGYASIAFH
jgi:AmmeMemoRadiSam system protein B